MRNTTKVWLFIVLLSLAQLFLGYKLADRLGLFLGFLSAVGLNIVVFFFGESQLLKKLKASRWQGQDPWGLNERLKRIAHRAGTKAPHLYVFENETPAAFAVGHTWRSGSICLSSGLLKTFTEAELEATLAHQLCHIQRLDTFAFGVSSTLANSFIGIAQYLDQIWPFKFQNSFTRRPFLNLLSPISWFIIRLSVGHKNYFENDELAATLLPDRKALAQALWKLDSYSETGPMTIPPCTSHLFIVNPEGKKEKNWFLITHPKVELRIKKLIGYYPL